MKPIKLFVGKMHIFVMLEEVVHLETIMLQKTEVRTQFSYS
jgi:hypothetical protein